MSQPLAPIALFVYNRPVHMQQVLDALVLNEEALESELYIFCDGPKENSIEENSVKIAEVRTIARTEKRFKNVHVAERAANMGLSRSIISGVTEVISKHGKIIVIEDDILASPGFLKYMNDALEMYEKDEPVGCIHAWNYSMDVEGFSSDTFFLRGADCWGWATWKRAWQLFNPDGKQLLETIEEKKLQYEFNRKGTHEFVEMLKDQIAHKNDSWAIRWHASLFVNNRYCLFPIKPLVENIGLDSSGTHCGSFDWEQDKINGLKLEKIEISENELFFKKYRQYLTSEKRKNQLKRVKKLLSVFRLNKA